MKNKLYFFTAVVFLFSSVSFAQQTSLDEIRSSYKSFNYQNVIELSDNLLEANNLSKEEIIELQTMKAVSHYSLNDEAAARKSFIEILKLDKNYSLDPAFISPKIITSFENTKKDFNQIYEDKADEVVDGLNTEEKPIKQQMLLPDKSYMLKSIILPGWGHLSRNSDTKGWILTGASAATLGTMIYYILDANDKEKKYLNETNPLLIPQKYDSFNTSYKTRNILIAGYAAIWLFSQLDLLVFDTGMDSAPLNISPGLDQQNNLSLQFQLKF